jgi:RNA recognition motif-containing protein
LVKHSKLPREHISTPKNTNLYVKPLENVTEQALLDVFGKYGQIGNVKIMLDPQTKTSLQVGFVRYVRQEDADNALRSLNNTSPFHDSPPIIVKYAETDEMRENRKKMKEERFPHVPNAQLENNSELRALIKQGKISPKVYFYFII